MNEAAYPVVNLTGDTLNLTLLLWMNRFTFLVDIRKAFIMKRLAKGGWIKTNFFFFEKGQVLVLLPVRRHHI